MDSNKDFTKTGLDHACDLWAKNPNISPKDALASATGMLTQVVSVLEFLMTPKGAAQLLYSMADDLAAKAADDKRNG